MKTYLRQCHCLAQAFLVLHTLYNLSSSISIDCFDLRSDLVTNGGGTTSIECPAPYTLMSWYFSYFHCFINYQTWIHIVINSGLETLQEGENDIRGNWIDDNECFVENGQPSAGTYAIANCCDLSSYSFTCNTYSSTFTSCNNCRSYIFMVLCI